MTLTQSFKLGFTLCVKNRDQHFFALGALTFLFPVALLAFSGLIGGYEIYKNTGVMYMSDWFFRVIGSTFVSKAIIAYYQQVVQRPMAVIKLNSLHNSILAFFAGVFFMLGNHLDLTNQASFNFGIFLCISASVMAVSRYLQTKKLIQEKA